MHKLIIWEININHLNIEKKSTFIIIELRIWKDKDTKSEAEQPKLLSNILRHASMHTIIIFTFGVKVCVTMVTQQNYGFTVHCIGDQIILPQMLLPFVSSDILS